MKALKALPGVKVVEEENVPETDAVSKTMESMINLDGAKLILPTSFGYWSPFVLDEAKANADVQFRHAAPLWKGSDPKNSGSYFAFLDQAHYVDGVAAGLASKTGKLGFVAAKPIGIVLRNINSFLTGARTTNPAATVQVIFTGDWSLPVREAEATNALVDAGCDLITCHVDGPKVVIQTAESRGVKCCGHNADQSSLAPKGFVTGAEYKWGHDLHRICRVDRQGRAAAQHHVRRLRQGHGAELALRGRGVRAGPQGGRRGDRQAEGGRADLHHLHQGQQGHDRAGERAGRQSTPSR